MPLDFDFWGADYDPARILHDFVLADPVRISWEEWQMIRTARHELIALAGDNADELETHPTKGPSPA